MEYVQNHKNLKYHKVKEIKGWPQICVTFCGHELEEYTLLPAPPRAYGVTSIQVLCKVCGMDRDGVVIMKKGNRK